MADEEVKSRAPMSEEGKANISAARQEGVVVRRYLDWLVSNKPKAGRTRTVESVDRELEGIDKRMVEADNLTRLKMIQERIDLLVERERIETSREAGVLEERFCAVAADYSRRMGISYAAWREFGVSTEILGRAGVMRANGHTNGDGAEMDNLVRVAAEG